MKEYPLRDTAVYNPHLLSKGELIGLFSARQDVLDSFLEELERCQPGEIPQHHLLVGQRGMGKTMLLRRLQFAIEDDPNLSTSWLPLTFPEEQYNVARLSDLWLNCLDSLCDALERYGKKEVADHLDSNLEALLGLEEENRADETLNLLLRMTSELDRRLVLLIDNVDLVLERITEQGWALRETLSHKPSILLVGASSRMLESSYKYNQPFYDFFQIYEFAGLRLDETTTVLNRYAEIWNNNEVLRIVQQEPARIRTLHTLTGGNPRTLALIYKILARGLDGNARADLENLLDHCTPLYKARFEALATQRQRVVDALAVRWHPASAAEIAQDLQIDVKAVSSQLTRLVREGIVQTVPFDPATKTGFQLAERFFNIWYLMRATRRTRRRLIWLVEFLKMFYSRNQLHAHTLAYLKSDLPSFPDDRVRSAEYSFALADAVHENSIRRALQTSALYSLIEDRGLRRRLGDLIDFGGHEAALRPRAEHKERLERVRDSVYAAKPDIKEWSPEVFWKHLSRSTLVLSQKEAIASSVDKLSAEELSVILQEFEKENFFVIQLVGSRTLAESLFKAFTEGWMQALEDFEGAENAAIFLGEPGLKTLSLAWSLDSTEDLEPDLEKLESRLNTVGSASVSSMWAKHVALVDSKSPKLLKILRLLGKQKMKSTLACLNLAAAWLRVGDSAKSIEYIERAQESSDLDEVPRFWEATIDKHRLRVIADFAEAKCSPQCLGNLERVARSAFRIPNKYPDFWGNITALSISMDLVESAEKAARKAVELSPQKHTAWSNLGIIFTFQDRYAEAEKAFHKAVELSPDNPTAWANLANIATVQKHYLEAEQAFHKIIEMEPEGASAWIGLGNVLGTQGRYIEAEGTFRKATELSPENADAWSGLGEALRQQGQCSSESEKALRKATEISIDHARAWESLSDLYGSQGRYMEAGEALRRLLELTPDHARAWSNLGTALLHQGRHQEGERTLRRALEISPDNIDARVNLGLSIGYQGRHLEAEDILRKVTESSPGDVDGWIKLAVMLELQGRHLEAEGIFRKTIEISPKRSRSWRGLGDSLYHQGHPVEAREAYQTAMTLDPSDVVAMNNLGWLLCQQCQELDEAETLVRSAMQIKPDDTILAHTLAYILGRKGKWSEAFEQIEHFIANASEEFCERHWPEIVTFFQEATAAGKTREAADLLERAGFAERWQPLRAALETLAVGRRSYLRRLAPEVRQPAEEILEQLESESDSSSVLPEA